MRCTCSTGTRYLAATRGGEVRPARRAHARRASPPLSRLARFPAALVPSPLSTLFGGVHDRFGVQIPRLLVKPLTKKNLTALRHTSDKPRRTGLSLFTYQSPAPALRYISAAWPGRRGPNATYKKKIDPLAKRKFVIPDASKSVRSTTLTTRLLPTVMSHPPEGGAASPLPYKGGGLATKHMFLLCDTCNLWRR